MLHRGHTTKPGVLNSTFAPRSELDVPEFQPIEVRVGSATLMTI